MTLVLMTGMQIVGLIDMDVSGPDFSEMYACHFTSYNFSTHYPNSVTAQLPIYGTDGRCVTF